MKSRILIAGSAVALGLGLASPASSQGMQPGAGGMQQPGMSGGAQGMDDGGTAMRKPARKKKVMKRSSKTKAMRQRQPAQQPEE